MACQICVAEACAPASVGWIPSSLRLHLPHQVPLGTAQTTLVPDKHAFASRALIVEQVPAPPCHAGSAVLTRVGAAAPAAAAVAPVAPPALALVAGVALAMGLPAAPREAAPPTAAVLPGLRIAAGARAPAVPTALMLGAPTGAAPTAGPTPGALVLELNAPIPAIADALSVLVGDLLSVPHAEMHNSALHSAAQ